MEGSAYLWGFLIPASVIAFCGYWLAAQCNGIVKISAGLQVDMRTRNKLIKRRGLQIGLFVRVCIRTSNATFVCSLIETHHR